MIEVRDSPELDQAIRLLTPREHSVRELRQKLIKRNYQPEKIEAVIAHLMELDYLSDARFTEIYVAERIRKGDGPLKIAANLQKRGVDRGLIEPTIDFDDDVWIERARAVLQKRFDSNKSCDELLLFTEWNRRRTFLVGRGFPPHIASQTLGKFRNV